MLVLAVMVHMLMCAPMGAPLPLSGRGATGQPGCFPGWLLMHAAPQFSPLSDTPCFLSPCWLSTSDSVCRTRFPPLTACVEGAISWCPATTWYPTCHRHSQYALGAHLVSASFFMGTAAAK